MADITQLKANIDGLTAKVAAATSLESSVATLVQGLVDQNKALSQQIASMSADTTSQADIDALATQVNQQADLLSLASDKLAAAVPQNTPASTPPATPTPAPAPNPTPAPEGQPATTETSTGSASGDPNAPATTTANTPQQDPPGTQTPAS